jgi:hypothetical protein
MMGSTRGLAPWLEQHQRLWVGSGMQAERNYHCSLNLKGVMNAMEL